MIHWNILEDKKINRSKKYWGHRPKKGTLTNKDYDIYDDRAIPREQYIENNANRPGIIIHNKNKREVNIIEVASPMSSVY